MGRAAPRALLLAALLFAGRPVQAAGGDSDAEATKREAGRTIYNARCYFCHGYSGDARTLAAGYLEPPPRAFVAADPRELSREAMRQAVRDGKPGTAMKGFAGLLGEVDIELVVDFVRDEFMHRRAPNTRYHTAANGWPNHERYRSAFPFVTGEIGLEVALDSLTDDQRRGRRLFLGSCVSCHERPGRSTAAARWEARPLSYPRNGHVAGEAPPVDAMTSASPYLRHEAAPRPGRLSAREQRGERIFQANCAFCHGADGSGRNWIGSFLEPHPRNLADPSFMAGMTRMRLAEAIADGLPQTSMPAWKDVLAADDIGAVVDYISRAFYPLAP